MWVAHEPGTCTNGGGRGGRGRGTANGGRGGNGGRGSGGGGGPTAATSHAHGLKTNASRANFEAHVTSALGAMDTGFGDDHQELINSIVNHMYQNLST